MTIKTILAAASAAVMLAGAANAQSLEESCTERMEADGRDASGCACLAEAVAGDDELIAELTELGAIDDPAERYDAASDEAKAVMDQCTRA